jgi:site-specific recombinase XerD
VGATAKETAELEAVPARFLDQSEELRMELSNEQLFSEAIECNHAGVGSSTLERYRDHLVHFAQYLASVHRSNFYEANKKQVRLFMGHLEKQGGENPDPARLRCEWCKARNYPDGREGPGWSASYRKSYLSALRFLHHHFQADDELPDIDPTVLESSPKVIVRRGYTPSKEEIKRLRPILRDKIAEKRLARSPCGFGATSGAILAGADHLGYPWIPVVSGAFGR